VRWLAADIGGTKTLLALAGADGGIVARRRYENSRFPSFDAILADFLAAHAAQPRAACLAVAGPVAENRARLTNLAWTLDGGELAARFGFPARLINDFEAVGHGITVLPTNDLLTLQAGQPVARGIKAVLGAGTGLGTAFLTWNGADYTVHASEGSHADFAPGDAMQISLLRYLWRRFGHASWERVVSGPGLVTLYDWLLDEADVPAEKPRKVVAQGDAAAITTAALSGSDAVAARALDVFLRVYGAEAGNLALKLLPTGGLYLAGGISPKIAPRLASDDFLLAFRAKGRFRGLVESFPVHVVMNPEVGLLGALKVAERVFLGS
jgi:glucokinase